MAFVVYLPSFTVAVSSAESLPFAELKASAYAFFTASLVNVAPLTPSISSPFAFRMFSFNVSIAAPPTFGVSSSAVISTSVISVSLTVSFTVTSPPNPLLVASYSPAVYFPDELPEVPQEVSTSIRHKEPITFFISFSLRDTYSLHYQVN